MKSVSDYKFKYFGTDGFRGEANVTLTSFQAYKAGRFLGWYYSFPGRRHTQGREKARIVIGKDTRLSSYMLEYSIAAGISASGADAYMLHVTTTPGVSYAAREGDFDCGIMLTASHNPYTDNGIKLVNCHGEKLDDYTTMLVEKYLDGDLQYIGVEEEDLPLATGEKIGRITDYVSGRNRYTGYLISLASNSYKHLSVGLDCANGAAWSIARSVFSALGARLYTIGDEPNGLNVNLGCGSTKIESLCRLVREKHLDMGFAFDGDGDRCIAVDENGFEVCGDKIMYVLASRLKARGMLNRDTVVTTVMSNSGLFSALEKAGINTVQTAVGDRFVYENMQKHGYSLGGEQSGHIILRKYATTGDGILTAIMLCEEICDSKLKLSQLCAPVTLYPQHTKNVRVTDKNAVLTSEKVQKKLDEVRSVIGANGRVLLRKSGTEPLIRIMTECENYADCIKHAEIIAEAIRQEGFCLEKAD